MTKRKTRIDSRDLRGQVVAGSEGTLVRLPNTHPADVEHNHDEQHPLVVYVGYSQKAPDHHLFKCMAYSDPPRRTVQLQAFKQWAFTPESKAGRGGCSMRDCPRDAVEMDMDLTVGRAYCLPCAHRRQGIIPCPWTQIEICYETWGLDKPPYNHPCPTCTGFERTA